MRRGIGALIELTVIMIGDALTAPIVVGTLDFAGNHLRAGLVHGILKGLPLVFGRPIRPGGHGKEKNRERQGGVCAFHLNGSPIMEPMVPVQAHPRRLARRANSLAVELPTA